ncbi:Fis family transcriptional regulator [uncultured Friedmanniella sp.]|uniref:Fis family transcriptional regulator n=1 Tax=uncultured Friedmanniella sp. TaxID=335381 RepID=UPI0035CA44EA
MNHAKAVRVDPESGALVIEQLQLKDPTVLSECRHWSQGRRGTPVELAELAGADLTAFVEAALAIGSSAMSAAAGVQQTYGIESLVAEVEKRASQAATSAAERTNTAVNQATEALLQASQLTKTAVVDAGQSARTTFAASVVAARDDLLAQVTSLLGGDEPQLLLRLQPLLDTFSRTLEQRSLSQTTALVEKVSKQFDPADPASPMAQQMRALSDTQARYADQAAEQQKGLTDKIDALTSELLASKATRLALSRTAAKGATYEEQTHALLAQIAAGLGDEYLETGNVVGLRTRSKKGDGLLTVPDTEARLVVEMTDSPRSSWSDYLKEAEDNRGAQAALGLVRSGSQLPGGPVLTLGPRRVVMVFDPETDDVHLLRCVVQLLRTAALSAAVRTENGEVAVADERIAAAVQTLDRISKIRKCAGQVKASASSIDIEAEALLTELNRLLTQARTALAGAVTAVRDDVA